MNIEKGIYMKNLNNLKKKNPLFQQMLKQYAKEVLSYACTTGDITTDERTTLKKKCSRFKELLSINDIARDENLKDVSSWIMQKI